MIVVGIVVLSLLAVGVLFVLKMRKAVIPSSIAISSTNTNNSEPVSPTKIPAQPKSLKSPADLKVANITLERTKGTSLVYAVGNINNASDHQRFGVKVELEFFDAGGKKVGTSTDYLQILEPRKEWHFRALVLDAKTVSARLARIKEDE